MSRLCRKCNAVIPMKIVIDGAQKSLQNRKFCLACSPWKKHNTKADIDKPPYLKHTTCYANWSKEDKQKNILSVLKRGLTRKRELIKMAGGKCKNCSYVYRGSERALTFHHRDPKDKLFQLSMNNLWSKKWEVVLIEFAKCDMLCMNCHAELEDKIEAEKPMNYRKWLGMDGAAET